ncbi:Protein PAQR-3 [Aphelenchoides avenae]|nr:Protein PAQR-3 [Aphelenchus avenae]
MGRCVRCLHGSHCLRHGQIRLVHKDTLHPCLWLNEHIHYFYRPAKLPWQLCLQSAFQVNNETINIWSHLFGFLFFTWLQFHNYFWALPRIRATTSDYVVTFLSLLGSQVCMALSAAYHTFGCISPQVRRGWLKADVFGVSAGLLGMYLSGLYNSFYCFQEAQRTYLCVLGLILLVSVYVPLRHNDENAKLWGRVGYLHLTYISIVAFGIYPAIHWVELHGGISHPHVVRWFPSLLVLFGLLGAAFTFYASLIPERLLPGSFDLVGCSHQLWHLLILSAMIYWHGAGIDLLTYYHTTPDACLYAEQVPSNSSLRVNISSANFLPHDSL